MLLKTAARAWRKPGRVSAVLYRIPRQVTELLLFAGGYSYPVCPRCGCTMEREYVNFCDRCGQRLGWEAFDFATVVHAPRKQG